METTLFNATNRVLSPKTTPKSLASIEIKPLYRLSEWNQFEHSLPPLAFIGLDIIHVDRKTPFLGGNSYLEKYVQQPERLRLPRKVRVTLRSQAGTTHLVYTSLQCH
jgi:hypothetical protein